MAAEKTIFDFSEQKAYRAGLGEQGLYDWTKEHLPSNYCPALGIIPQRADKNGALTDLIRNIFDNSTDDFKKTYRKVVTRLLNDWSEGEGSDYLARLVFFAGFMEITDAYGWLLKSSETETFKGKLGEEADLHQTMLRVLLGQVMDRGVDERAESLFKRDLQDDRYALVCYRALYTKNPGNGIAYLPHMIKMVTDRNIRESSFRLALTHFIDYTSPELLLDNLECIISKLSPEGSDCLLNTLGRLDWSDTQKS